MEANYLTAMLGFVEAKSLVAASSYCRMTGPLRAKLMQVTINRVFPRLRYPILPGFNCFVDRSVFEESGGFPAVPNEDTAFSRRLARTHPTGYRPQVLVECCLQDETVDFDVFYGVSDDRRRWFDLEHARETIGYDPVDDGDAWDGPPAEDGRR